jgi:hypothetical protein
MTAPTPPEQSAWKDYKAYAEQAFERYTTRANASIRQLTLAGLAVVWLLKATDPKVPAFSTELRGAAALFVIALAVDLIADLLAVHSVRQELGELEKRELKAHDQRKLWPDTETTMPPVDIPLGHMGQMFFVKSAALLVGFLLLLYDLGSRF